jgi:hypothetical protein
VFTQERALSALICLVVLDDNKRRAADAGAIEALVIAIAVRFPKASEMAS